MKLLKISTIALAMGLTGWVACGDSGSNKPDAPPLVLPGTGGSAIPLDTASGSGGAGGSTGTPDAALDTGRDIAFGPDASDTSLPPVVDGGQVLDAASFDTSPVDGVLLPPNICTGLTPAQCHDAIINAATDPSVSALDPGANPPVPFPNCSAL